MTMTRTIAAAGCLLLSFSMSALADLDARVAELQAMPADARKAALKAMDAEERRGLWFALKRQQRQGPVAGSGVYRDAGGSAGAEPRRAPGGSGRAVGTITYDDGMMSTTFGGGAIVGNRFDTHTGVPVLASGTVSTVVAVVVAGSGSLSPAAGFVLLGPQTTGGGAMAVFSSFTGASGTTDTVSFTGMGAQYPGNSFYVLFGDFDTVYVPAFGTGTVNSQGHHGVVGYTGGMGPNITSTFDFGGTLNGLIRASGNILPVELIDSGVE